MFLKNIGKDTFRVVMNARMGEASQKMSGLDLGSDTGSLDDWGANLAMRAWIGKAPACPTDPRRGRGIRPEGHLCYFRPFSANG